MKKPHHLLGKPGNNQTGRGTFPPGHEGFKSGPQIAAAKTLTRIIAEILMEDAENGRTRAENMVRAQAIKGEAGDLDALEFFANRMLGRPAQQLNLANHEGGPLDELMDFLNGRTRGIPSNPDTVQ